MIVVTGMPGGAGKDEFIAVARSVGFMDVHMGRVSGTTPGCAGYPSLTAI